MFNVGGSQPKSTRNFDDFSVIEFLLQTQLREILCDRRCLLENTKRKKYQMI